MMPSVELPEMTSTEAGSSTANSQDSRPARPGGTLTHAWRTLARSPRLAMLCIGLITLAVSMTLAFIHWPVPSVHDEFSYLLACDTYAHGRLTNPTHPMWRYFESFHIIQQPSYASKYPPGQGLILAAGQILTGYPLVGVWISLALAAMALVWMLAGWMPWRWAILGGLIFALHANIQFAWGHSYWGGAVAFFGASLLFGAFARLQKKLIVRHALILAAGSILLAISRPYEGFIASTVVGCLLVWQQVRAATPDWKQFAVRLVLPAASVLAIGLAGIAYYNYAVTGHALRMPYAVHEQAYGSSPLFVWQASKPLPTYNHPALKEFHEGWGLDAWRQHQSFLGFLQYKIITTARLWGFFFGAILTIPMLVSLRVLREKRLRFALSMIGILYTSSLLVFWMMPHYFAPAAPLLFLVIVEAVRSARAAARRGWPMARQAPAYLMAAQLVLLLAAAFSLAATPGDSWADARSAIADELAEQPGRHLVLVSYGTDHDVHQEWVYNGADLEGEKILWARSFGLKEDQPLLEHFHNRKVWRLDADVEPRKLELISSPEKLRSSSAKASSPADPFADETP
jgi:hypothetical protein